VPAAAAEAVRPRPVLGRSGVTAALGPAFVAAIAYVDPGNFATNFAAGANTGYRLLWVVLLANLVAMPIQFLAAKLGLITGRSLPRLCRDALPRPVAWLMWLQAEIVAMATDLAEFVGAAIGLNLLFGVPLPVAAGITAALAFVILALQRRGYRPFEVAIGSLLVLISAGLFYLALRIPPSASGSLAGLVPRFGGSGGLLLAVGIIGATVMPHAIYLHSGLMSSRAEGLSRAERLRLLRFGRVDIGIAMTLAGLVNLTMLAVAARLFHHAGRTGPATLETVHGDLGRMVGGAAALAFAVALLASGISSSSVGTAAGQIVMEGFIGARVPLWLRRLVTMTPALILLCSGVDPTRALVLSQVVLSFGIPFALVALLTLTSRRSLMHEHVNNRLTVACMTGVVVVISALNVLLLGQQFL
jgi:manganese transport protein